MFKHDPHMRLVILTRVLLIFGGALFTLFISGLFIPRSTLHGKGHNILRNKSLIKGLEISINGYRTEYNRLPSSLHSLPNDGALIRSEGSLVKSLMAKDPTDNPRNIKFFEPSTSKGNSLGILPDQTLARVVDSWGEAYYLHADIDGDEQIPNPAPPSRKSPPQIPAKVIIYSSGPDKDPATWKDNIKSWD